MKLGVGIFIVTKDIEKWGRWVLSQVAGGVPIQLNNYIIIHSPIATFVIGEKFEKVIPQAIHIVLYDGEDLSDDEKSALRNIPYHYIEFEEGN